jgi:ribulose-phosphate 3-epimerase
MVAAPERQIGSFAQAGAGIITVALEACPHIHRVVQLIKEAGARAGVSINPGTPLSSLEEILPELDLVLVMSVNPGAGGQTFIPTTLDKIARLRELLDHQDLACELEVDGGIKAENAARVVSAGARVLVAGSAVFHDGETVTAAISRIRSAIQ